MSDALMKNANGAECSASTRTNTSACLSAPAAENDATPSTHGCKSAIPDPWAVFVQGISGKETCPGPCTVEVASPAGIEPTEPSAHRATRTSTTRTMTQQKRIEALKRRLATAKAKVTRIDWRKTAIAKQLSSLRHEDTELTHTRRDLADEVAMLELALGSDA